MIDPALLDRLREADPDVYEEWKGMMITFPVIREGSRISDAWLQHVLQEAITSKRLQFAIKSGIDRITARIWSEKNINGPHTQSDGDSPAEALLRAYLAAIGNRAWL